ncbi:MAG: flagellin [Pseudomonadota bacterium]
MTGLSSIGPGLAATLALDIQDLREQVTRASKEAATGRYADLTLQLEGRIGKGMLAEKAVNDIDVQREQLVIREGRLDTVQRSLDTIQSLSLGLDARTFSSIGTGDTSVRTAISRDANNALETAFLNLNARFGDRYLFSGDATATPPFGDVDDLLADIAAIAATEPTAAQFTAAVNDYFDDPAGGWQTNIYNGTATTSDPDGILAIDPGITELIKGIAVLTFADPDSGLAYGGETNDVLEFAANTIAGGLSKFTNLRADLGVIQGRVELQQNQLDLEETVVTRTFNQLTARDQYEAAAELQELETNLEASYLLTARLNNLNLLNFLR